MPTNSTLRVYWAVVVAVSNGVPVLEQAYSELHATARDQWVRRYLNDFGNAAVRTWLQADNLLEAVASFNVAGVRQLWMYATNVPVHQEAHPLLQRCLPPAPPPEVAVYVYDGVVEQVRASDARTVVYLHDNVNITAGAPAPPIPEALVELTID